MTTPDQSCPIDHDLMRKIHAEHGPIQAELRELVEPLSTRLAEQIYTDTIDWDPVSNWDSASPDPIVSDLPYGENLHADPYTLPPHLFGRHPKKADLVIPADIEQQQALARDFIERRPTPTGIYPSDEYIQTNLPDQLDEIRFSGQSIDIEKWARYTSAADRQLRSDFYHFEGAMLHRSRNTQRFLSSHGHLVDHPDVRRFENYMYAISDALFTDDQSRIRSQPTGYIVMPIGAYGATFAEKTLATTHYAIERTRMVCADLAQELAVGHEKTIGTYMARGRDIEQGFTSSHGEALTISLEEGVLSIMQTIALLTAEKVPGYENPDALLHDIIENGLIEQFTRATPLGLVGPFALSGCYFKQPLEVTEHGLRLSPDLLATLKQFRYQQIARMMLDWQEFHDGETTDQPSVLGTICPAAFAHGAVSGISKAMLAAFESIDKPAARRKRAGRLLASAAHSGTSAMTV